MKNPRQTLDRICPDHDFNIYSNNVLHRNLDLTILIPVYNQQDYLVSCLDSVLSQKTGFSYEVIAVNDGSTDRSGEILKCYQDRIRILTQENRGLSAARNAGLRDFRGRFVTFLDADDCLAENAVEVMLHAAIRNQADILEGGMDKLRAGDHGEWKRVPFLRYEASQCDRGFGFLSGYACGKLYRSDLWEHYQFPEGYWYEDTFPNMILMAKPFSVFTIPEVLYLYRENPNSITGAQKGKPKLIDSYRLTEHLLEVQKQEGLISPGTAKQFIRQTLVNINRAGNLGMEAVEAEFHLSAALYQNYFCDFPEPEGLTPDQRNLYLCLKGDSWLRYRLILGKNQMIRMLAQAKG